MQRYLLTAILSDHMGAEETTRWKTELSSRVDEFGGVPIRTVVLGRRGLSYRLKRRDAGYEHAGTPIVVEFELPRNNVASLKQWLRREPNVLRSMLTRSEIFHTAPVPAGAPLVSQPIPPAATTTDSVEPARESREQRVRETLSPTELDQRLDEILEVKEL